jgi:hypothetical protein
LTICARRWIERGGCKDRPLGATLVNVLVHSRDSKDQLVSGIVDHILSVLRVRCNKEISASISSSISLVNNRVGSRHLVQGIPMQLL